MDHYDLIIIGTGSGNSVVTADFDDKQVAIVERGVFGGTCLNVGCIPTKMFVYAADLARSIRTASRFGIDAEVTSVRWPDIRDRVFGRIDPIAEAGKNYRVHGPNTTAYLGSARFVGERTLEIALPDSDPVTITGDQVVIATGSHAVVPSLFAQLGPAGETYHTSDTVMRLEELPASMLIVGGGYIACEFAHVFSALGVEVTQVVRGTTLLRHLDRDIHEAFTRIAAGQWNVLLERTVESYDGTKAVLDDGSVLTPGVVLVATGRAPSTEGLGVDAAGVELHSDGRVVVDDHGRTTAAGVWSLGDVCNLHQLKHVANHEARVVVHNLVHPEDLLSFDLAPVPAGVFTSPQIATVGPTETELIEAGTPYVAKTQRFGDTAYGWAMEDTESIFKILADPTTGRILAAHVMGPNASTLIQPVLQAMAFDQHATQVARRQYWIHPALSEVTENALLGLGLDV